jgi:hypothetical protein
VPCAGARPSFDACTVGVWSLGLIMRKHGNLLSPDVQVPLVSELLAIGVLIRRPEGAHTGGEHRRHSLLGFVSVSYWLMRRRVSVAIAMALVCGGQGAIAESGWVTAGPSQLSSKSSVKLYTSGSDACETDAVLISRPEGSQRTATQNGRTATTYSLMAMDWWGVVSISCTTFAPSLSPDQELSLLIGRRKYFLSWKDAKVIQEKEVFIGGYPAMQIDLLWGEEQNLFSRVRILLANEKLYMASIMATRDFEKAVGISALLDDAIQLRRPKRGSHVAAGPERRSGRVTSEGAIRRIPRTHALSAPRPSSGWYPTRGWCAENGSCYGDISQITGRPKTIRVRGHFRRDGTYVRGHYRSRR